jgi:hypothetical protein
MVERLIVVVLTLEIRHARGLISIPIEFLPNNLDSTKVVPLPTKLSSTSSFFRLRDEIILFGICGTYFEE